jgi:Protein of unknown function (DUF1573)
LRAADEEVRAAAPIADSPTLERTTVSAGLDLRIEPQHYHAGKVVATSANHKLTMSAQLINDSDDPIRIAQLEKSCICTSISLENPTIPPHGRTRLNASFTLRNTPGPNGVVIRVLTSPPGNATKVITCDWDLVTPLHVVPESYRFGRLDLGVGAAARLELWNRGIVLCGKCAVEVAGDRGLIAARFEGGPPVTRVLEHADENDSIQEDRRLGTIVLEAQPQSQAGDFARLVDVTVQCAGITRGRVRVPVSFAARPRIELRPARVWLGLAPPGKRLEYRVSVQSNDGSSFRVVSVATKSGSIRAQGSFSEKRDVKARLELSVVAPDRYGVHRGELEICIEEETRSHLALPISLMVQANELGGGSP